MNLNGGKFSIRGILPSNPSGFQADAVPDGVIYHIKTPNYPTFHFEWHTWKKNVYLIREDLPGPKRGEIVAFNIEDHGQAQNAVLIWLRGYQTATNDRAPVPFLKAEDY